VTSRPAAALDPELLSLPLRECASAALQAAQSAGASHADVRIERLRGQDLALRNGRLERLGDDVGVGIAVRVIADGTWGFTSSPDVTVDEAVRLARAAVEVAKASRPLNREPVELADEPVYDDVSWVSAYEVDPFGVPSADKVALFADWSQRLLASDDVDHVDVSLQQALEGKFYADTAGTTTTQQRIRVQPRVTATRVDPVAASRRCARSRCRRPRLGVPHRRAVRLGRRARAAAVAAGREGQGVLGRAGPLRPRHRPVQPVADDPRVDRPRDRARPGAGLRGGLRRDLVRDARPARHAAVRLAGHAGHRRPHDPARPGDHRLGRRGRADAGVGHRARRRARRLPARPAHGPAERRRARRLALQRLRLRRLAAHVPVQRMANVSLQPAPAGRPPRSSSAGRARHLRRRRQELVDRHAALQLPVHRPALLRDPGGRLVGQLRDVAYQATTTDFWGSLEAVGGPQTYALGGRFNCGKAQPGQIAAVSHGCPTALFRGVQVLNTAREGGR
jgi:TldD protein